MPGPREIRKSSTRWQANVCWLRNPNPNDLRSRFSGRHRRRQKAHDHLITIRKRSSDINRRWAATHSLIGIPKVKVVTEFRKRKDQDVLGRSVSGRNISNNEIAAIIKRESVE